MPSCAPGRWRRAVRIRHWTTPRISLTTRSGRRSRQSCAHCSQPRGSSRTTPTGRWPFWRLKAFAWNRLHSIPPNWRRFWFLGWRRLIWTRSPRRLASLQAERWLAAERRGRSCGCVRGAAGANRGLRRRHARTTGDPRLRRWLAVRGACSSRDPRLASARAGSPGSCRRRSRSCGSAPREEALEPTGSLEPLDRRRRARRHRTAGHAFRGDRRI